MAGPVVPHGRGADDAPGDGLLMAQCLDLGMQFFQLRAHVVGHAGEITLSLLNKRATPATGRRPGGWTEGAATPWPLRA
jgi:hypothetical protein